MTMSGDVITVAPTTNSQADTYTMLVTHSTVDEGDISFNTVTLEVGVCVITHIDIPSDPTDPTPIEYTIHALNNINIDLSSPGFV